MIRKSPNQYRRTLANNDNDIIQMQYKHRCMSQKKIDIDMEKCEAELKSKTIVGFLENKEPRRDETLMMQAEQ